MPNTTYFLKLYLDNINCYGEKKPKLANKRHGIMYKFNQKTH